MSKTYAGDRTIDGIKVTVDGELLNERYDIETFTDLGFEWTYVGPAPQQLALAILADHLSDDKQALALSEALTIKVISELDNSWTLTSEEIDAVLAEFSNLT